MKKEQDFDMESYISKRMLEITSLEDRRLFKEIAEKLLLEVNNYNQNAYKTLEQKILNEHKTKQNDFAIYLTLTDLEHYDATDTFMYPMIAKDTNKNKPSINTIRKILKTGEKQKLFSIYLKTSVSEIYKLIHRERTFHGVIRTQKSEYKGEFSISRNEQYMDLIKNLYYIFGVNYQPWMTVCEAYITKMFDVYLCSVEQVSEKEEIEEIVIDFEEYADQVNYHMIPLWNLEMKLEKTSTYPDACIDKINYEHHIFSHRLKPECEYLIMNTDVEITNIRRLNGDLIISCPLETPCEWQFYQVNKRNGKEYYLYPILSNQSKESFAGCLTEMFRRSIKTKSELARLMEAFSYSNYVVFQDFEILDTKPEGLEAYNYNMDGFILDEIRIGRSCQTLVLSFSAVEQTNYLNEDIMSFLVTQVQKLFPEYLCIGKLI
ncbi:hypothetical protein [Lachnotalea glycerini]|uniref:Normocyte-binding protein n=1 Tax=Lachnotalea glycerini TaxID=1763509 RepID=A0A371JCH3_9FIRM|nr:hypothetical protein [Lachnotalea glycerini]RDY30435.1 hypothetical protein CG710_014655 [Lachnotalea glycerini]